jgi:signal transduction histidine kinase
VYHFAANELAHGLNSQSERIYRAFPVFDNDPFFSRDSDLTTGEHHILLHLVEFNIVVLVAAGFASYWLAKRTLRPVELAYERQKSFTADASHELRTPLTALKMAAEVGLMDRTAGKAELRDVIASNLEEANKLERLINNLLRLSRLEASELRQHFGQVSLAKVIGAAITDTEALATSKHITVKTDQVKEEVPGDADSLTQLLVVLLDNAIKYSAEKSTIEITSSYTADTIELQVHDHGSGIAPDALQHVFDRFYRANAARTNEGSESGYGLGLSIAKYIADVHHGQLTLTSTLGQGTTATVHLPLTTVTN